MARAAMTFRYYATLLYDRILHTHPHYAGQCPYDILLNVSELDVELTQLCAFVLKSILNDCFDAGLSIPDS